MQDIQIMQSNERLCKIKVQLAEGIQKERQAAKKERIEVILEAKLEYETAVGEI